MFLGNFKEHSKNILLFYCKLLFIFLIDISICTSIMHFNNLKNLID
jgi:hypothetical protein